MQHVQCVHPPGLRLGFAGRLMTRTNVAQSRPQDWSYLAEGGSTIVFSYGGPFHHSFTGKVLRLRKVSLSEASRNRTTDEDDLVIAFQKTVMATLVPVNLLPELDPVLLDSEWLAALELLRNRDRPPERRATDQIDKARQKGILATDVIGGTDVLSIEIKPKWGFLPNSAHLSQDTAEIKTSTCRFCMHTRFKFKDGDLPTQYCPLDFFSTDEDRRKKAIRDLWDGWVQSDGTLNNMRIFVSGKMIRPSESYSSLEDFLSTTTQVPDALVTALLPYLRSPALRTLSNLQRSLDPLDIEGIAKLYAMAQPDAKGAVVQNPSLEQLQDFAASYHSVYRALDHSKLSTENIDTYLIAYLLSATFKDCSMIFRIYRPEMAENPSSISSDAISIIDLDLKGANRLEKWVQLDRDIVEYYQHTVQPKRCLE